MTSNPPGVVSPKVSVLMSVYNGEPHLRESLESILDQSMSEFEFVIVDDGSTDNTPRILANYAAKDERVRLTRNSRNIGLTRSLNKGLAISKGEYVARHDADDISLHKRLELQSRFLDTHPRVGVLGGAFEQIDQKGDHLRLVTVPEEHDVLRASLLMMNPLCHGTVMARKTLIDEVGGYDERIRYAQDYDLWWRVSRIASLSALPEVLVRRRKGETLSKLHGEEQAQIGLQISLRSVRESLNGGYLDDAAYGRFWWANRGRYHELHRGDIGRLDEFWSMLADHPAGPRVWGPRVLRLALGLLRHGHLRAGASLLWIGTHRLGFPGRMFRGQVKHAKRPEGIGP